MSEELLTELLAEIKELRDDIAALPDSMGDAMMRAMTCPEGLDEMAKAQMKIYERNRLKINADQDEVCRARREQMQGGGLRS